MGPQPPPSRRYQVSGPASARLCPPSIKHSWRHPLVASIFWAAEPSGFGGLLISWKPNCASLDSFSDVAWAFQLHILALSIFSLLRKNRSILNLLIMSFSQIARKLIILVNCPLGVLSIPECEHFHVRLPFFAPHKVWCLYLAWYAAKLRKSCYPFLQKLTKIEFLLTPPPSFARS